VAVCLFHSIGKRTERDGAIVNIPRQYVDLELFYECDSCGCYHAIAFDGDCTDEENRFTGGELDEIYGTDGWTAVQS
jgi:hypothetical protein